MPMTLYNTVEYVHREQNLHILLSGKLLIFRVVRTGSKLPQSEPQNSQKFPNYDFF